MFFKKCKKTSCGCVRRRLSGCWIVVDACDSSNCVAQGRLQIAKKLRRSTIVFSAPHLQVSLQKEWPKGDGFLGRLRPSSGATRIRRCKRHLSPSAIDSQPSRCLNNFVLFIPRPLCYEITTGFDLIGPQSNELHDGLFTQKNPRSVPKKSTKIQKILKKI